MGRLDSGAMLRVRVSDLVQLPLRRTVIMDTTNSGRDRLMGEFPRWERYVRWED